MFAVNSSGNHAPWAPAIEFWTTQYANTKVAMISRKSSQATAAAMPRVWVS